MQGKSKKIGNIVLHQGDAMEAYAKWASPTVIIADGPYGISSFPGDLRSPKGLANWYEPHIKVWSEKSLPETTLWFFNTEIGWAHIHPLLEKYGWIYRGFNTWDKGIAHIAGNSNTKSLRKLPVVTEVFVQYVKEPKFKVDQNELTMQQWLRHEWKRTGLPMSETNKASGVKNAASRKYFTPDHLWYFPPAEAFENIAKYANKHGAKEGRPYFSINEKIPRKKEWEKMRAKFYCPPGITNVWRESPVNGNERLKNGNKAVHINQKPLKLMNLLISSSSDKNDVIWEPFGGLFTACIAATELGRRAYGAEINETFFKTALERINHHQKNLKLGL